MFCQKTIQKPHLFFILLLSFTFFFIFQCSAIKAKVNGMIGMPAGKQKLQLGVSIFFCPCILFVNDIFNMGSFIGSGWPYLPCSGITSKNPYRLGLISFFISQRRPHGGSNVRLSVQNKGVY